MDGWLNGWTDGQVSECMDLSGFIKNKFSSTNTRRKCH